MSGEYGGHSFSNSFPIIRLPNVFVKYSLVVSALSNHRRIFIFGMHADILYLTLSSEQQYFSFNSFAVIGGQKFRFSQEKGHLLVAWQGHRGDLPPTPCGCNMFNKH